MKQQIVMISRLSKNKSKIKLNQKEIAKPICEGILLVTSQDELNYASSGLNWHKAMNSMSSGGYYVLCGSKYFDAPNKKWTPILKDDGHGIKCVGFEREAD